MVRDCIWIDVVVLKRHIVAWRIISRHLRYALTEICGVGGVVAGDGRPDMCSTSFGFQTQGYAGDRVSFDNSFVARVPELIKRNSV